MLQSVFLNVLLVILINNSVSYINNKNKIIYNFENHYRSNNNLRGNTGVLLEKIDQEILLVEKKMTLYMKKMIL